MRHRHFRTATGFTLIEIMAVVIIIGLLATIVTTAVVGHVARARRTVARTQIRSIMDALELFRLDNGFYPTTEQGLDALVHKPTTGRIPAKWHEPNYLPAIPKDPWGNPYVYLCPGGEGRGYDLASLAADGQPGGTGEAEDVVSWKLEE